MTVCFLREAALASAFATCMRPTARWIGPLRGTVWARIPDPVLPAFTGFPPIQLCP